MEFNQAKHGENENKLDKLWIEEIRNSDKMWWCKNPKPLQNRKSNTGIEADLLKILRGGEA